MKKLLFVSMGCFMLSFCAVAQTEADSIAAPHRDTMRPLSAASAITPQKPARFQPNPKKAGLYSAILPGAGQLYNHDYWKIPVIYAGIGVAGYFFVNNLDKYQSYRKAYIGRINNPYPTDQYVNIYSSDQLQQLQNDYNKYLDLTVMLSALGYGLQVLDAITSAHLKNFDISRDISLRCRPVLVPGGAGMGIVMNFR